MWSCADSSTRKSVPRVVEFVTSGHSKTSLSDAADHRHSKCSVIVIDASFIDLIVPPSQNGNGLSVLPLLVGSGLEIDA
jgi:hypothetical protein